MQDLLHEGAAYIHSSKYTLKELGKSQGLGTFRAMDARVLFGRNVARLRAARGLSQTQLAFDLDPTGRGISQSYVSQLEAGKRDPKLSTLVAFAHALDVPVSEVVAGCEAGEIRSDRELG